MDANVRKIQVFATAARLGSLTRAAEELGCAQSTASRMVSSLEEDWGARLFERRGPSLRLTQEGGQLLHDARSVCEAYEALVRHVGDLRGLEAGTVSLAAPSSIVSWRLAEPLGRFLADHPLLEADIHECTYGEAEHLMLDGKVDLAFVPRELVKSIGCVASLFDRDEIVIVAPKGYFAGEIGSIPVERLVGGRFIADSETAPLLQRELENPCVRFVTSDITAILAMVEAGLGVSLLPSLALERTALAVDVRHLAAPAYRSIYLVHRTPDELSHAASAFLGYLPR
ncbi:LysR family transcriptional regulator [Thermophilibacter immobilis]|uniref:LysR family transcriptional regulator n=1 Tax=Thermophilibacter immobilis TaxID=2779519 RepID=A0A7S7M8Q1_9ACTN|nr:LysR family transcriptional regulator [Thermophilibacter immobilis]QOY60517.1 LysR family transcriptional regulator [Thermophilibacter immobilis]